MQRKTMCVLGVLTGARRAGPVAAFALALACFAAPAAAQQLVRVHGTIQLPELGSSDLPTGGEVYGLYDLAPLVISESGTEATYEGYVYEGWHVQLTASFYQCDVPGCPSPGYSDPGERLQFVFAELDVPFGETDLQFDGALPGDYGFESVSGSVAVSGGTIGSGRVSFVTLRFNEYGAPDVFHFATRPLDVVDDTHATFDAQVGYGTVVSTYVTVQFAECQVTPYPPGTSGPTGFVVSSGSPVVLPEIQFANPQDCSSKLDIRLQPASTATQAAVGASYAYKAAVTNTSQDYVTDGQVHFELEGDVRPRGIPGQERYGNLFVCDATGYTPQTNTSTVDCNIPFIAPGQEVVGTLTIGALAPGDITVRASAFTPGAVPVTASATVTAVDQPGTDLQVYPSFTRNPSNLYLTNYLIFEVVNAGPEVAHDVEVRVSSFGPAVNWDKTTRGQYYFYLDVGYARKLPVECAQEAASGDLVCLIPTLDAWDALEIAADFVPQGDGAVTFQMEATGAADPDPTNNVAFAVSEVLPAQIADLSSTHVALTSGPSLGDPISFEWRVHNDGPAPGTVWSYFYGQGLQGYQVVNAGPYDWCYNGYDTIVCQFYDLAPGATATINVTALPYFAGDYVTTSLAEWVYGAGYDPNRDNDTFELITHIAGPTPTSSTTRDTVAASGYQRVPCLPGDFFFSILAKTKESSLYKSNVHDDGTDSSFLFNDLTWRATEGNGIVFTDDYQVHWFSLVRGSVGEKDRLRIRGGSTEDYRYSQDFMWREDTWDGSKGLTLTWRWTYHWEVDELGRWFEVLDSTHFECRR